MVIIYRDYDHLAGPYGLALVFRSSEAVHGANVGGFFMDGERGYEHGSLFYQVEIGFLLLASPCHRQGWQRESGQKPKLIL